MASRQLALEWYGGNVQSWERRRRDENAVTAESFRSNGRSTSRGGNRWAQCPLRDGGKSGEKVVLFSPWPESIFAFAPVWDGLTKQFGC